MRECWRVATLLTALLLGKAAFAADPWRNESFQLASKSGSKPYLIQLALPAGTAPESGYPIIYVLDATTAFGIVVDVVRLQEMFFGPAVVVGIRYEDPFEVQRRGFDFTPIPAPHRKPQPPPGDEGGADAFLAFMQNELRSAITQRVKIDANRQALFGHSLGGIFALHVLFSQPQSFDTYVAASPSLGRLGSELIPEQHAFQGKGVTGVPRRVLITVGELEGKGPSPEELRFAQKHHIPLPPRTPPTQDTISEAQKMATSLKSVKGLEVSFAEFAGETHQSSIPAYLGRGVRWTLTGWYPP